MLALLCLPLLGAIVAAAAYYVFVAQGGALAAGPGPDALRLQNAGQPWSHRWAGGVHRFEVRGGDSLVGDGATKNRSEAYSPIKLPAGKPFLISFDLMVEPGPPNSAAWMTLVQLQSTFDFGESGHSPPFAIEMAGEAMRVVIRTDPNRISGYQSFKYTKLFSDKGIERGHWYRFRILVKFDPFGDGALKVWRDDAKIVDFTGAIGFDDAVGAYFKEGVYRAASPERYAANFRNLSIAPARE